MSGYILVQIEVVQTKVAVALSNFAKFLFFSCFFPVFIAKRSIDYGRNAFINIVE